MFWVLILDGLAIILSYAYLHGFVKDSHKKYGFYPVILLILKKEAFFGNGLILRKIFIFSVAICVLALSGFKIGYSSGLLTCGVLGN